MFTLRINYRFDGYGYGTAGGCALLITVFRKLALWVMPSFPQ